MTFRSVFHRISSQVKILFQKGAFDIIAGNFLTKFLVFFGTIFLVRALTKEQFGLLGFIENIYSYVYIFAGMGLTNAILRFVLLSKEGSEEFGYFRYALRKGTAFNLMLWIPAALFSCFYPFAPEFESARFLFPVFMVALPFQYLTDVSFFTFRAKFANRRFALTTLAFSIVLISGKYLGAVTGGVPGVIAAKIGVSGVFGLLLLGMVYREFFKGQTARRMDNSTRRVVDRYSVQYMITNGIWAIFMLNDIMLLSIFNRDPAVVADYKVAYFLPGNLSIISGAVGMFVAPYFVKNETDSKWIMKNYRKTLISSAGLVGGAIIVFILFADPLVSMLFGRQYLNIVPLMRLLLAASFANSGIRLATANILAAMGQIRYNMIVSIAGVVLQIVMNILIIPMMGVYGVAITSITVYWFMAISLVTVFVARYRTGKSGIIR